MPICKLLANKPADHSGILLLFTTHGGVDNLPMDGVAECGAEFTQILRFPLIDKTFVLQFKVAASSVVV
jgi:hypothetical protein